MQAREDEEDKDLLVDIGTSKHKSKARLNHGVASSSAPVARSRLAFTADSPAAPGQQSKHGVTASTLPSADDLQTHGQTPQRNSSPTIAAAPAAAAGASQSIDAPLFDIDVSPAPKSAATGASCKHARLPVVQPSPTPLAMDVEVDVSFDNAATGASKAYKSDQHHIASSHAQQRQHAVQHANGHSPVQEVLHSSKSQSNCKLPANPQCCSRDPSATSQQLGLDIDIDVDPCMTNSTAGRPQTDSLLQTRQQQPSQQTHSSPQHRYVDNAPQAHPQEQDAEQLSSPGLGMDIDIDDDDPVPAHMAAAAASADPISNRTQAPVGTNAAQPACHQLLPRHNMQSGPHAVSPDISSTPADPEGVSESKPSLPTNGFSHTRFKPPRRMPPVLRNITGRIAAVSCAGPQIPPSSASGAGRKVASCAGLQNPSSSASAAARNASSCSVAPAAAAVPAAKSDASPSGTDNATDADAAPTRTLKRLRKAGQSTARQSTDAASNGMSSKLHSRQEALTGKAHIRFDQLPGAESSSMQTDIEDADDDEELQAALQASSQQWQQEQQQPAWSSQHTQQQQGQQQQGQQQQSQQLQHRAPSWHRHRPHSQGLDDCHQFSALLLAKTDSGFSDIEDNQGNLSRIQSSCSQRTGFLPASAYAAANTDAAAAKVQTAESADDMNNTCHGSGYAAGTAEKAKPGHTLKMQSGMHNADMGYRPQGDDNVAGTVERGEPKQTSWGGFSSASSLLQQQRENDRHAKSDLLKKSNPFARASAQSQKVFIALVTAQVLLAA